MTAVIYTNCQKCGTSLRDATSRIFGYGPECRKAMTPAQLRAAVIRNDPSHTPPAAVRPASAQARRNHTELQRITSPVVAEKRCTHDGIPGQCPLCRREADPWRCAERIITITKRIPMDQRIAAQKAAAIRRYNPDLAHQLTIGA